MNKKKVDAMLPKAVDVLNEVGIAKNGVIKKTYRGQISTFGAAIMNGSLLAAVAFFNDNGSSTIDRTLLMKAVYRLINPEDKNGNLFDYVKLKKKNNKEWEAREEIINAAIALKLAMNLYALKGDSDE